MQVLPFYVVCDASYSMLGEPIEAINEALPELHHEIGTNPAVCDRTRFCLIAFSNTADVVLELCDLSDLEEMPGLKASGSTNYSAAFRLAKTTIAADVARLKAMGDVVNRPVLFFLTDGAPTDGTWKEVHTELISAENPTRPHIISFGIGQADRAVVTRIATFKAFLQEDDSITPATALREFAAALTKSIVRSAAASSDVPTLLIPEHVEGFTSLPLDTL